MIEEYLFYHYNYGSNSPSFTKTAFHPASVFSLHYARSFSCQRLHGSAFPYYSHNQIRDESTPGHGIGLAVVKDIAHSYGGRLSIQASDLGGAEIMVSIPPVSSAKGA